MKNKVTKKFKVLYVITQIRIATKGTAGRW